MSGEFSAISEREKGLQRGLSSAQLSMIAIAGAIGTRLFLGAGFAIGFAGQSELISYAIGAVFTLLLMGASARGGWPCARSGARATADSSGFQAGPVSADRTALLSLGGRDETCGAGVRFDRSELKIPEIVSGDKWAGGV